MNGLCRLTDKRCYVLLILIRVRISSSTSTSTASSPSNRSTKSNGWGGQNFRANILFIINQEGWIDGCFQHFKVDPVGHLKAFIFSQILHPVDEFPGDSLLFQLLRQGDIQGYREFALTRYLPSRNIFGCNFHIFRHKNNRLSACLQRIPSPAQNAKCLPVSSRQLQQRHLSSVRPLSSKDLEIRLDLLGQNATRIVDVFDFLHIHLRQNQVLHQLHFLPKPCSSTGSKHLVQRLAHTDVYFFRMKESSKRSADPIPFVLPVICRCAHRPQQENQRGEQSSLSIFRILYSDHKTIGHCRTALQVTSESPQSRDMYTMSDTPRFYQCYILLSRNDDDSNEHTSYSGAHSRNQRSHGRLSSVHIRIGDIHDFDQWIQPRIKSSDQVLFIIVRNFSFRKIKTVYIGIQRKKE